MINSLYVHIPFCKKKCLYCDFNSYVRLDIQDDYIKALLTEIKRINQSKFKTIFIGGGTPTILSISNLKKLLSELKKFNADEFTVETNPGTLDDQKARILKEYGVNRISIGLQAWQNNLLERLGRIHRVEDFLISYEMLKKIGFSNINIDLMFGIPNQTMSNWVQTIENVLKLNPSHVSCYSLIIEEGTLYYEMYEKNQLTLIDEDTERQMYYYAVESLNKKGIKRYEISNFSKEGYECSHNITYWMDEEYIGVGAGAHSYVQNKRFSNYKNIDRYIEGIYLRNAIEESEVIETYDEMSEFMFMGLRMTKGIEKERFLKRFNKDVYDVYGDKINILKQKNLIIDDGKNIMLTDKGIDISNQVFINFLK
ncbi:oxygen-independent coproporphyrinogen-3 oxidase [Caloramator quimbayensis]|uniref:Heme chaperone HemW n=1 Tax=Caloramator quimbayensis TaxID=1147123 RepID=A0A1T4X8P6_9CLOT|nr:radical SAM family heme chaperone HemW [Caloramator quimbayensis]SKA85819.1 oxygen-independent coproporphyrinogen-3 oxidase [Caloramator quimbayensis]